MKKSFIKSLGFMMTFLMVFQGGAAVAMAKPASTERYPTVVVNEFSTKAYAIKEDGSLWGWGNMVGDGTEERRTTPVKIMDDVISVDTSTAMSAAIKKDHSLWVWGDHAELSDLIRYTATKDISNELNANGFLINHVLRPRKIMDNVRSIDMEDNVLAIVKTDGSVYLYGSYFYGDNAQFLTNRKTYTSLNTFGKLPINDAAAIKLTEHEGIFILKNDNSLWFCGNILERYVLDSMRSQYVRTRDQILPNDDNSALGKIVEPVKVMDDVVEFDNSYHRYYALKSDGTLLVWGGYGNMHDYNENPIIPKGIANVKSMNEDMYVKTDGTLWGKGDCAFGQLANGTKEGDFYALNGWIQSQYTQCMEDVEYVSTNDRTTFVLKSDGSLWGCGLADDGIIGNGANGETVDDHFHDKRIQVTPVKVMDHVKLLSSMGNKTAKASSSKIMVNGEEVALQAYTIDGNTYFKIRDVGAMLNGTDHQFNVVWDNQKKAILLQAGAEYQMVGGELALVGQENKNASLSSSKVYLDENQISLKAYTIDGSTYFKLRDLGQAMGFNVGWDSAGGNIVITA